MKALTTLAMVGLLSLMLACGSKSKPETTQPKNEPVEKAEPEPAPEPETPAEEPEPEPEPSKQASLGATIYFEFDSSELSAEARETLNSNYDWLSEDASRTLTIEGHTDEKGTNEYNLALGERRARAALDYLVRLGADSGRIKIITYGEERPASTEDAENRRSVFVATKK